MIPSRLPSEARPATARLRAGVLTAPDAEALVALFADALTEHGVSGHFCMVREGSRLSPLLGDDPALIRAADTWTVEADDWRMLLGRPLRPLDPAARARLQGYAVLYAARALALRELADDVATECGLTLRQRYVLGRRLAGLAPVDIAAEARLTLATVAATVDQAVATLGAPGPAEAIAVAARRGWLAVTAFENCSSSPQRFTYNRAQNS